jgi:hypothetical protein
MSLKQISSITFILLFSLYATSALPVFASEENSISTSPSSSPRQNLRSNKPSSMPIEKRVELKERQESLQQKRDELKTMRASAKAKTKERACEVTTNRLNDVSTRYEKNHQGHVEKYKQLAQRLQNVVNSTKTSGQNTTNLEASTRLLYEKIRNVDIEHNKYLELLKKAKDLACATSEISYTQALEEARAQLLKVRAATLEVREFYRSNVREEIIKLRSNRPSASPRATNSSVENTSPKASAPPTLAASASPQSRTQ